MRVFRSFDAPVSMALSCVRVLDPAATCHVDLGALCHGICLSAWSPVFERTFAWLGWFRRLVVRQERLTTMTCALSIFAAALIALRRSSIHF
jgi:hypothetical protein